MASTRLPGKVLFELGARPVLGWIIRAARESDVTSDLVVATTSKGEDDAIVDFASEHGVRTFRGPTQDVLARFVGATGHLGDDDLVVRATADNPLVDPDLLRAVVNHGERRGADYVGLRAVPRGVGVSLARVSALRRADVEANGHHRVHVTSYLYSHPEHFRIEWIKFEPDASDLRLTLDTRADFQLLEAIVDQLGDRAPGWREVVTLLRENPNLARLNANVSQKELREG